MTKRIADNHEHDGNIMLVGHAPSLESCTRQLCGGNAKSQEEFAEITRKIPFLSIVNCEKDLTSGQWKIKPLPIASMKHMQLEEFDWNNLNRPFNNFKKPISNMGSFQNGYKRSSTYFSYPYG